MTSCKATRKRRRNDGPAMAHLREVVDEDSGEVYHVETTRQAKRRHKRNAGAQYQPTVGQINAADIWNRQEEKIRKDKEREEKKKRSKAREAAKEARLKELQQEDLKKGRISVEDTWGKVNASQNRLHTFFGLPQKAHNKGPATFKEVDEKGHVDDTVEYAVGENSQPNAHGVAPDQDISAQELQDIFTTSPLSPGDQAQIEASLEIDTTSRPKGNNASPQHGIQASAKRKHSEISQHSQAVMPPPKRLLRSSPTTEKVKIGVEDQRSPDQEELIALHQSPLAKRTDSQVSAQNIEKPQISPTSNSKGLGLPSATQIVRDTLSDLCSQDLADDFLEQEKENQSPFKSRSALGLKQRTGSGGSSRRKMTKAPSFHDFLGELSDSECCDILDGFQSDAFDDEGLDDESLLALAATQQLESELLTSSKHEINVSDNKTISGPNVDYYASFSEKPEPKSGSMSKLGDSFVMEGLSDEDLLEGLRDFENANRNCHVNDADYFQVVQQPKKKRRSLPWIKHPIHYSQREYADCDEMTSPSASCGRIHQVLFGSQ